MHNTHKNNSIIRWMPQENFCGYTLMVAISGELANSRDVSYMRMN